MWRAQTSRKGQQILKAVRQLTTESAPISKPKPPSKLNNLRYFTFLGLSLPAATVGVIGYAWFDPQFRSILEANVPYAKDLLKKILSEIEEEPATGIQKPEAHITPGKVQDGGLITATTVFSNSEDDAIPTGRKLSSVQGTIQEKSVTIETATDVQPKRLEEDEKAANAALEALVTKLLANSQTLVAETVKAQTEAASSIRNHATLLKQAMDSTDDTEKDVGWQAVMTAAREKDQAMMRASEQVFESKKCIEKLQDIIQEGKANPVTQNNPAISTASKTLTDLMKDLGTVNSKVRQAEFEANMVQRYKELVEKERKQFQKEIESLVPASKSGSDKKLSEDEMNALIAHAYRRIEQLQNQIAVLQDVEKQKLALALESQRQEDCKITEVVVAEERHHLQDELAADRSKLEIEYLVRLEEEIRKQLARQAAAHADHLKDVLSVQQQELSEEYARALQLKLLEEREKFQTEVAGWIARLKGIDVAIEARAASEKLARRAQNLWLACIALNSVIQFGSDQSEGTTFKPLRENVEAILRAGSEHQFVREVASKFPSAVLDRGVSTEDELRCRFYRVSRICHRLGLVDATNTSIYRYMLSYLHSLIVFDSVTAGSELEEVDISMLDTFDLLAYAQHWMDKGNLDLALRFMNQLTGESRLAASDWINEARLFLETRQIAYTLTAYASASGQAKTF